MGTSVFTINKLLQEIFFDAKASNVRIDVVIVRLDHAVENEPVVKLNLILVLGHVVDKVACLILGC